MPDDWDLDCTMRYLNEYPLPAGFTWPHRDGGERVAHPVHAMVMGYGKWLRETPYFKGLFELCHEIALHAGDALGDGFWLAEQLTALRAAQPEIKDRPNEPLAHALRAVFRAQKLREVQPTLF